jgi:hypothetical protein
MNLRQLVSPLVLAAALAACGGSVASEEPAPTPAQPSAHPPSQAPAPTTPPVAPDANAVLGDYGYDDASGYRSTTLHATVTTGALWSYGCQEVRSGEIFPDAHGDFWTRGSKSQLGGGYPQGAPPPTDVVVCGTVSEDRRTIRFTVVDASATTCAGAFTTVTKDVAPRLLGCP